MHNHGALGDAPSTNQSTLVKANKMNNNDVSINTAISAILSNKEILKDNKASSLSALLLFGEQVSLLKQTVPSKKMRGVQIKKRFPPSYNMDEALRSNSVWLYDALNNPRREANNIFQVLDLQQIEDIYTKKGNPTVIRRMYRDAKANVQALAA